MKNQFIEIGADPKKEKGNILKLYIEEVVKRNLPIFKITRGMYQFGIGNKLKTLMGLATLRAARLTKNKNLTHNILRGCNISVPKQILLEKDDKDLKKIEGLKFPLVAKPFDKSLSFGVTLDIRDKNQLKKAISYAFKCGSKVVIEEFIGHSFDYRLSFFDGHYLGTMVSIPQYIKGDGKKTTQQLINELNVWRKKEYNLKPRENKWIYHMALLSYGLTFNSIPAKGKKIKIYSGSGLYENVSEKIHPENIELCRMASDVLGLTLSGVDFMSPNASIPYYKNGGKINEINDFPDLGIYTKTPIGKKINVAEKAVQIMFPTDKSAWVPIKYKGRIITEFNELKKLLNVKPREVFLSDPDRKIKNKKLPLIAFLTNFRVTKINI